MKRRNLKLSLVIFVSVLFSWNAYGQFTSLGNETAVNTTTANDQRSVRVSTNSDGKVAMVWESQDQDGDAGTIVFKIIGSDGGDLVAETVANSWTTDNQSFPDVVFSDNGNMIITWMSEGQDGDGWGIYHKVFGDDGSVVNAEAIVNTTTAGHQRFPRIGADKDGNYTIAWESEGEIKAQRFASDGTTVGSELAVNTNTTNSQMYPAIDVAKNGEFIIAWQSDLSAGNFDIHAQLFDETGAAVNNEFRANSTTSYLQIAPSVAMDTTGNFVVTWSSYGQDGDNYGVYGRLFESSGAAVDDPFKVNTTTTSAQTESSVTMSEGGVFLVAWISYGQDGDDGGVYLQAYSPTGVAKGSETLVNTRTTDFQIQPDLSLHGDLDDLTVVWQDGEHASTASHDGSGYGIYLQQYEMEDITDPEAIAQDINAYLDATGAVTVAAADVDNGSIDASEITLVLDKTDFTCSDLGDNSGTLTVTDANDNSATASMTITVLDTIRPTVITQDITLYLDETGTVSFTKNDIDNGSTDNCSFTLSLDETSFSNTDLGENTVTLTATDGSGNTRSAEATVTVAKGTQTITFNTLSAKTYGDASFSLGATASSDLDVSYASSDTDVATISGNTVTIIGAGTTSITASQAGDDNYSAASNVQQTLTINKAALTITADASQSKIYGSSDPAFSYSITSGSLVGSDALSGSLTRESGDNVGDYAIQQGTLAAGDDYTVSFISNDFSITQKSLTITADESQSKVYGESDPVFTYALTSGSLESGDGLSGVLSRNAGEDAGDYGITIGTLTAGGNYSINFVSKDFTIDQAALTATADDKSKTYGDANPSLTITYDGFVNGDDETAITEPTISTLADATSNVGDYDITLTGGSATNYAISNTDGTLTIGQAALTATADDKSKTYGDANPMLTITYDGFVNGDDETAITEPTISTLADATSSVGDYDITLTGGSATNYTISNTDGTLSIGQAALTATADDKSKTYGDANPALTITYDGFVNGDDETAITEPTISTLADATSNVGDYDITLTGGSATNYAISNTDGTLSIGQAALTATADDKSKTYGDANPMLTITYDGFVNGDDETAITEPSISTLADATSNVGDYDITLTGGSATNYTISNTDGTLTIGQAALTATADDKSKTYGDANPALTITYNGFVNGDDETAITEPTISTLADATSNVGDYDITLTGGSATNYTISNTDGTLTIGQAALTATADDKSKTYGDANPMLTITYDGFVNGDDETAITEPSISTLADATSSVGDYDITLTGGSATNYSISNIDGTLSIGQASLTATADDKSKTYGDANPTLTITYDGFVNSDDETAITEPTISTLANAASSVGDYDITLTGGSATNYAITNTEGTLTIGQATLTVTADDKSKTYGDVNPTLTYSISGYLLGEDESVLTQTPSVTTLAEASSDAGNYDLTPSGAQANNYDFNYVEGTLTINKATATATLSDASKTYGDPNPNFEVSFTGLVNGDQPEDITGISFQTDADANSDVGNYDFTISVSGSNNYIFNANTAKLTVNKAALTATADNKSKTYGDANPALTITYDGFVNGDDETAITEPSISTLADVTSDVGDYDITLTGGTATNYTISNTDGTLSIGQAALTATADDKSKTYGDANPALTITYDGFLNGDDETAITEPTISTLADATSSVGDYAITLTGGTATNYAISNTDGILSISQAALTATADDKSKTYGDANPTLTITYNGFVNGDDETAITEPSISTLADATSNVGDYDITLTGGTATNYAISNTDGILSIGQAALTATADDKSKTYGDVNPALTITYDGFVNGDDETVITEPIISTLADATSNVGDYDITLTGGSATNYSISNTDGTLTIGQAALTATADDKSKTYGDTNPALTITYNGFVNGDDETAITQPTISTLADATSNVGDYDITLTGGSATNYSISNTDGTLTIGQAALTATADDKSKTYGDANPTFTITYAGFVNGDDKTDITEPSISTLADATSSVGDYDITLSGGSATNYAISNTDGTLSIGQAALTATADDKSKTYGDANPALTITYNGFVNGDDETAITTEPVASTTAGVTSSAGEYAIDLAGGVADNYSFSWNRGTLTINKTVLTATADDKSKIYGDVNPSFTITYDGFVNGDNATDITEPIASTLASATSSVGDYAITLTGGSATNYAISNTDGTLSIGQAVLTATADDKSKTYGGANPAFTITYNGFVNGDDETDITEPSISTLADATSSVGDYDITLTGGSATNYAISNTDGTLTIGQAALTATADDKSKTYGDANPALTITYDGFINGDDETAITEPSISTLADATSSVGDYDITLTGGSATNYTISNTDGTLSIGQATLTATADDKSKTYGDANPTLTITYNGFVNGDDEIAITEPSISTLADVTSSVGDYDITLTGGSATNYAISNTDGTLTIGQATLTAIADDKSKTYGDVNPSLTITYNGFVNGDDETDITEPSISTLADATSNVGVYDITLTGGSATNYSISNTDGTLSIGQAALTATADDKVKTYGDANPTLTITYDGFVNGDNETVITEPSISTLADATSTVGDYDITLTGGSATNYSISSMAGTLTVERAILTVTAEDKSKTYGDPNPALTYAITGYVLGEDMSELTGIPEVVTLAETTSKVDNYDIVPLGAQANNYDFNYVLGTLTISKAIAVATISDASKVYGDPNPEFEVSFTGLVNGDQPEDVTGIDFKTDADERSDVGVYDVTVSLNGSDNYNLSSNTAKLTIGQAALTATADAKSKTYGDENPALTITYDGFVNDDDVTVITEPGISTLADATSSVGDYDITLTGGSATNYSISNTDGTLTIGQAVLTATADDKSKIYGDANPTLTISYNGFVNGNDETDITEPSISTLADATSNVGDYDIMLSGGSATNYAISNTDGTLTIGQATLTVTADDKSKTYGDVNPTLTITYNGFVNGDDETGITEPSISTLADATSNVGDYDITLSGGSATNYSISNTDGTLTIGQATLTATADAKGKTYGDENPALTITYDGFVNGDDETAITEPSISTLADATSSVGDYDIILTGGSATNYSISNTDGTLTIGQAVLTATADDKSKIYGDANPALTISYNGFVNGDDATDITKPSVSTQANVTSNVGYYDIVLAEGAATNYLLVRNNGVLSIGKSELVIKANDQVFNRGEEVPELTMSFDGFVNSDSEEEIDELPSISTTAVGSSQRGEYPIQLSGGLDDNYSLTLVNGKMTITGPVVDLVASLEFEKTGIEESAVEQLNIDNTGDGELIISSIEVPTGFGVDVEGLTADAGSEETLSVTFTPTEVQVYNGKLILVTNDGEMEIDLNGEGVLVAAIGEEQLRSSQVNVYPNPANKYLVVDLSEAGIFQSTIKMVDAKGNTAFVEKVDGQTEKEIDVSSLTQGVYLLMVESQRGTVIKKVIIKR